MHYLCWEEAIFIHSAYVGTDGWWGWGWGWGGGENSVTSNVSPCEYVTIFIIPICAASGSKYSIFVFSVYNKSIEESEKRTASSPDLFLSLFNQISCCLYIHRTLIYIYILTQFDSIFLPSFHLTTNLAYFHALYIYIYISFYL